MTAFLMASGAIKASTIQVDDVDAVDWEVRPLSELFAQNNSYIHEFFQNVSENNFGGTYFPDVNEQDSPYFLFMHNSSFGHGGFASFQLVTLKNSNIETVDAIGTYSTDFENKVSSNIKFSESLSGADLEKLYSQNLVSDEIKSQFIDYHRGLRKKFGSLPTELVRYSLNNSSKGYWSVVQLDKQAFEDLVQLFDSKKDLDAVAAGMIPDWNDKLVYTDAPTSEYSELISLQKEAHKFTQEVFTILNWPFPEMTGFGMEFPITVYSVNPLVPNYHLFAEKVENDIQFVTINDDVSNFRVDAVNSIFDLITKFRADQQDSIKIHKRGDSEVYEYSYTTLRVSPLDAAIHPIEYRYQEYRGEVNGEFLPHGNGFLTLKEGSTVLSGTFENGLPHGLIHEHINGKLVSAKHYEEGIENGPFIYFDPSTSAVVSEGWMVYGTPYNTKTYHYEANHDDEGVENARRPETLKFTKQFLYDEHSAEPLLVGTETTNVRRMWHYEDGTKLAVDGDTAVFQFENGDQVSGKFKYFNYTDSPANTRRGIGRGTFYGKTKFLPSDNSYVLEGVFDEELGRIPDGDVHVIVHDDVHNKKVKKSAKLKDGEITYNKTTIFDVLFDATLNSINTGEVDFEFIFFRTGNVAGKWLETAMGTDIPPISYSEDYSWEGNYESSGEIREAELSERGYEFEPTPYEKLEHNIDKVYEFTYKNSIVKFYMRKPVKGELKIRIEDSGKGRPKDDRDTSNGGKRPHAAFDYLTTPGQDIVSPVDGVIVNQGVKSLGSELHTIWIDTLAITGEHLRFKIFYSELSGDDEAALNAIRAKLGDRAGLRVKSGEVISSAQSLNAEYNEPHRNNPNHKHISDHIHFEIHVIEPYMGWRAKNKIPNPPFITPEKPVLRIERNKQKAGRPYRTDVVQSPTPH